jgi:hypothetical protein
LIGSVGLRRDLAATDEAYIPDTDKKLFNMDLGFDYSDLNTLFTDYKGKILETLTKDVAGQVKEQGMTVL